MLYIFSAITGFSALRDHKGRQRTHNNGFPPSMRTPACFGRGKHSPCLAEKNLWRRNLWRRQMGKPKSNDITQRRGEKPNIFFLKYLRVNYCAWLKPTTLFSNHFGFLGFLPMGGWFSKNVQENQRICLCQMSLVGIKGDFWEEGQCGTVVRVLDFDLELLHLVPYLCWAPH